MRRETPPPPPRPLKFIRPTDRMPPRPGPSKIPPTKKRKVWEEESEDDSEPGLEGVDNVFDDDDDDSEDDQEDDQEDDSDLDAEAPRAVAWQGDDDLRVSGSEDEDDDEDSDNDGPEEESSKLVSSRYLQFTAG